MLIFNHTISVSFSFILPFNQEHYLVYSSIPREASLIIPPDQAFTFSAARKYFEMPKVMHIGQYFAVGSKLTLILQPSS